MALENVTHGAREWCQLDAQRGGSYQMHNAGRLHNDTTAARPPACLPATESKRYATHTLTHSQTDREKLLASKWPPSRSTPLRSSSLLAPRGAARRIAYHTPDRSHAEHTCGMLQKCAGQPVGGRLSGRASAAPACCQSATALPAACPHCCPLGSTSHRIESHRIESLLDSRPPRRERYYCTTAL